MPFDDALDLGISHRSLQYSAHCDDLLLTQSFSCGEQIPLGIHNHSGQITSPFHTSPFHVVVWVDAIN